MNHYEKLTHYFEQFPGTGFRQARRFVDHLLISSPDDIKELANLILSIKTAVATCNDCFRFYALNNNNDSRCSFCSRPEDRDQAKLMVLERDSDLKAVEKAADYNGLYFVLGGTVPLFNEKKKTDILRGGALKKLVTERAGKELKEIILAFSVNPDGENTARYVISLIRDLTDKHKITVTVLGRGMSTGSELEYADPETIKSALAGRFEQNLS